MIYRDGETPMCPRCRSELRGRRMGSFCARCGGLWTDEDALAERWRQLTGHPPPPTFSHRVDAEPRLECVACGSSMEKVSFGSVELDRCVGHGVWFDPGELERAGAVAMIQSQVPADRDDFDVMLRAELRLAELSSEAGDADDAKFLVGLSVAILEEACRRWPADDVLAGRLERVRDKLSLRWRGGRPPR